MRDNKYDIGPYSEEELIEFGNYIIHSVNDTLRNYYEKEVEVKNEYFMDVDNYDEYNIYGWKEKLKVRRRDQKIDQLLNGFSKT